MDYASGYEMPSSFVWGFVLLNRNYFFHFVDHCLTMIVSVTFRFVALNYPFDNFNFPQIRLLFLDNVYIC